MTRDMDLVRELLAFIEQHHTFGHFIDSKTIVIEGRSSDEIRYHFQIMSDAGLIHIASNSISLAIGLTWYGHDFLDLSRESDRWKKAKQMMAAAGGAAFQVWMSLLVKLAAEKLGLPD